MKDKLDKYITESIKKFVNGEFSLPLDDKNEIFVIPQKKEEKNSNEKQINRFK